MGPPIREPTEPTVEDRHPDLVAVVDDIWSVADPVRAAVAILERDTDVDDLVGILQGGEVLQYHRLSNTVDALEFAEDGEFEPASRRFRDSVSNPEHYVARADLDWAWLHPRYRWLLGASP